MDATGRRSGLARRLGVGRLRDSRLVALYAIGPPSDACQLNRTLVEAGPTGWWYGAKLPSGAPIAGFHTLGRHAGQFATDLAAWKRALGNTTHMLRLLPHTSFERPVHVLPAWGGRLTQFSGDRWIACGDAAACFDPISSQGIFSALHSGNEAGLAVADALRRRNEKLGQYSERMETVWKSYSGRLRSVYRMERRWPRELFWSSLANDYL